MPSYSPIELEKFVRDRAPQIAKDIRVAAQKARNEADLVAEVEKLLEKFAQNFDIQLNLSRERTLINGRADAVYNRFVIEYEPPNSLRKSNTYQANKHAVEQVKQYMTGLERLDRHRKERLAGVALDGGFYIFVRFRDDHWHIDDPIPVNAHSTETFLRYLLSLSTELALTPENLVRDFGENSNTARQVVPALYAALTNAFQRAENEACCRKVHILFQQWQHQFREVSGYDPTSGQLDPSELAKLYAVRDRSPDLERLFFTIHSYYAIFIKLLALQIGHFYLMPKIGTGLASAANYDSGKLRAWLQELERGGLFAQLGIRNFLEGDFFGWYLDVWDESLDAVLKRIIADLANYSLVTLDIDPEETRDLLKQLYQNLMPKKLRHALGEYYTPDWLAERLLNQLGYGGDPTVRVLDPACGSGTFPVLAIKRVRQYAAEKLLPPSEVLGQILNNIVGFDLNPLAVISARTNYLLALGDLLEARNGDISIPVYLADSILTPSEGKDLFTSYGYSFTTAVGRFIIPSSLVQAQYIELLAALLEESIHVQLSTQQFRVRVLSSFPMKAPEDDPDLILLENLYDQLLKLEQQGINGIWARIIKNAFAPLFQPKFDLIAGNPPWVNWDALPTNYRDETKPTWEYYGLFSLIGWRARMGGGEKDISALMTYVAIDKYLKNNGMLGFIITQSIFKTEGAGEGFRRFQLDGREYIGVIHVDDMVEISPFESASNRTSVLVVKKGTKTNYPVPYSYWRKKKKGCRIPENANLNEVINEYCIIKNFKAQPVDQRLPFSPWMSAKPKALASIQKIIGKSKYRAFMGVHGWAIGIYWLNVISTLPDGTILVTNIAERGRKGDIDNIQARIEPDLIYPLLQGRDIHRWTASSNMHILLVQDPEQRKGWDEKWLAINLPHTYSYLKHFEKQLRNRSGYQKYYNTDTDPFYSMYNVGNYTLSPYKLVWRYISTELTCSVAGKFDAPGGCKPAIPDTKLVMVPFEEENEAHFVCACLQSSPAIFIVKTYAVNIQIATHVLKYVNVPEWNPNDETHQRLALLSKKAHQEMSNGNLSNINDMEIEIDLLSAKVWGLNNDELREIQESLEELG